MATALPFRNRIARRGRDFTAPPGDDQTMGHHRFRPGIGLPLTRGVSLFLALFTLLNLVGARWVRGFDANIWWIDLRFAPDWIVSAGLALAAAALLCLAAGWTGHAAVRRGVVLVVAALMAAMAWNGLLFYRAWFAGRIRPGMPIPLSLVLGAALGLILWWAVRLRRSATRRQRLVLLAAFVGSLAAFPMAQMLFFGKTDYRRPADAVVVFGARAYADGTPSFVLADRTRTAVNLYQQGLASSLVFSGGPGDGATSEPQAMRTMAMAMGVPSSAIILDEGGVNTEQTVSHTVPIFERHHFRAVLAVSHFYHLPRVKLAYDRRLSADHSTIQVLTVPAEDPRLLRQMPWYVAREVPALWTYYLRPLFAGN